MNRFPALSAACATLLLFACGQANQDEATETAQAGSTPASATARPAAFAQCVACHAVEPGRNGIGPTLAGVFGRKAAALPGVTYSPALKQSGLTWDEATLDPWLEAPAKMVPGTRMVYPGLRDPAARAEVIAYLKTLR
jgi:cytochrome c